MDDMIMTAKEIFPQDSGTHLWDIVRQVWTYFREIKMAISRDDLSN